MDESDPISVAKSALNDSVRNLHATSDFDDLDWLPDDFADRLIEMAWEHRAQIDGGRFKRQLRKYIKELAPEEG